MNPYRTTVNDLIAVLKRIADAAEVHEFHCHEIETELGVKAWDPDFDERLEPDFDDKREET